MINFSEDNVFNLKPISPNEMQKDVESLYISGEKTLGAYRTVRDQVIFTNKRIITVDVKGVTGQKRDYSSLPYSKVQYFSVQTAGFAEIIPDCELQLFFNNGFKAIFEFKGDCDIIDIGQSISEYVLGEED